MQLSSPKLSQKNAKKKAKKKAKAAAEKALAVSQTNKTEIKETAEVKSEPKQWHPNKEDLIAYMDEFIDTCIFREGDSKFVIEDFEIKLLPAQKKEDPLTIIPELMKGTLIVSKKIQNKDEPVVKIPFAVVPTVEKNQDGSISAYYQIKLTTCNTRENIEAQQARQEKINENLAILPVIDLYYSDKEEPPKKLKYLSYDMPCKVESVALGTKAELAGIVKKTPRVKQSGFFVGISRPRDFKHTLEADMGNHKIKSDALKWDMDAIDAKLQSGQTNTKKDILGFDLAPEDVIGAEHFMKLLDKFIGACLYQKGEKFQFEVENVRLILPYKQGKQLFYSPKANSGILIVKNQQGEIRLRIPFEIIGNSVIKENGASTVKYLLQLPEGSPEKVFRDTSAAATKAWAATLERIKNFDEELWAYEGRDKTVIYNHLRKDKITYASIGTATKEDVPIVIKEGVVSFIPVANPVVPKLPVTPTIPVSFADNESKEKALATTLRTLGLEIKQQGPKKQIIGLSEFLGYLDDFIKNCIWKSGDKKVEVRDFELILPQQSEGLLAVSGKSKKSSTGKILVSNDKGLRLTLAFTINPIIDTSIRVDVKYQIVINFENTGLPGALLGNLKRRVEDFKKTLDIYAAKPAVNLQLLRQEDTHFNLSFADQYMVLAPTQTFIALHQQGMFTPVAPKTVTQENSTVSVVAQEPETQQILKL